MARPVLAFPRSNSPAAPTPDGDPDVATATGTTNDARLIVLASVLLASFFALIAQAFLGQERTPGRQLMVFGAFFCFGPALAACGSAYLMRRPQRVRSQVWSGFLAALGWLLSGAILGGMLVWSLQGVDQAVYSGDSAPLSLDRFLAGLTTGAMSVLVTLLWRTGVLHHLERWPTLLRLIRTAAVTAALATAIALFDVNVFPDSLSYVPYVGPATLVLAGHLPLRDVFSQYGLNYLVFTLAFKLLPYSLSTAAAVVTSANVLYYVAFVAIAVKLSKHRAIIALASIGTLLFLSSAYLYNATRTPSVLGMRFLPPLLVIVSLCYLKPKAHFSVASVVSLVGASAWSIEAMCFSGGLYAAFLVLSGWYRRDAWPDTGKRLLVLLAWLMAPHVVLSGIYLILLHGLPDYATYLELVRNVGTDPSTNWTAIVDPSVHAWALLGWGYALGLVYSLHRAWFATPSRDAEGRTAAVVASISVLGVGELSYYVARSSTPLLTFLAWPLALLTLIALDRCIGRRGARRGPIQLAGVVLACLGVPLMMGVVADRFLRPADAIWSNSTALRAELDAPTTPLAPLVHTWRLMQDTAPFPPPETDPLNAPGTRRITYSYPYVQAALAYALSQKWQSADPEPLLILPESATVLFYERKASRLGVAHPAVDGLSPTLFNRALDRLHRVVSGDVVIVGNPAAWSQEVPLDRAVLDQLSAMCTLTEIDRASDYPELSADARERVAVTAYRLACRS